MTVKTRLNLQSACAAVVIIVILGIAWQYPGALGLILTAGITGFVLLIAVSAWNIHGIVKPLRHLIAGIDKVSSGDFTVTVEIKSKDELATMANSLNKMLEELRSVLAGVVTTSGILTMTADDLDTATAQLAGNTSELATQLATVAAASEEMSVTSAEISQSCGMVSQGASRASESTIIGTDVVQQTVTMIEQIAERVKESATTVGNLGARSDQIGEIISTIEDIADQTNLLALNAAIEAARAGEQGRGFAVVADEVRALAERTTKATQEIGRMIRAIQEETRGAVCTMETGVVEVEQGASKAGRSNETLASIQEQITVVTMQANQIATAAEEQTATTHEISSNIHQVSEVVQETAQKVQESAGSASMLADMAKQLEQMVGRFKLVA